MKLLITWLLASTAIFAQAPLNHYVASAATTKLTLQQASGTSGNQVQPEFLAVYCTLASTITFSWNGAGATTTAGTAIMYPGTFIPATATVWTASNVGSGTTGPVYNVPATSERDFTLEQLRLPAGTINSNFTITTSNSCTITVQWREF